MAGKSDGGVLKTNMFTRGMSFGTTLGNFGDLEEWEKAPKDAPADAGGGAPSTLPKKRKNRSPD